MSTPRLDYELSFQRREAHLIDVELRVHGLGGRAVLDLTMAAWTPGSYKIRDYARFVEGFEVVSDDQGRAFPVKKLDKSSYRIDLGGRQGETAGPLVVRYQVYAWEQTVRTSHVDDRHAFIHGAGTFFVVRGEPNWPIRVRLRRPDGWRTATELPPAGGRQRVAIIDDDGDCFEAADYDTLVDSPIELGKFRMVAFQARGLPHRVVICGELGNLDLGRFQADLVSIIEATASVFPSPPPLDRYTFIIHVVPDGGDGGGLEHSNCCAIQCRRHAFKPRAAYEDFLSLCAHEYFHVWNGKRLRPHQLGPFDYFHEVPCGELWFVEGMTAYYDELLLRRAGLVSRERYLERLLDKMIRLSDQPGRCRESLEEASFDAWIKLYQRTERSPSSQVSYYLKGELVAATLDLTIRSRTQGRRSLDDVLGWLLERYAPPSPGYTARQLHDAFDQAVGVELGDVLERLVQRPGEDGLREALALAGLRLKKRKTDAPAALPAKPSRPLAGLDVHLRPGSDGARIGAVLDGGAGLAAGLSAGDEIIAVDGQRVDSQSLGPRLEERKPGEGVRLSLFRRDRLRQVTVLLSSLSSPALVAVPDEEADPAAQVVCESWLGSVS